VRPTSRARGLDIDEVVAVFKSKCRRRPRPYVQRMGAPAGRPREYGTGDHAQPAAAGTPDVRSIESFTKQKIDILTVRRSLMRTKRLKSPSLDRELILAGELDDVRVVWSIPGQKEFRHRGIASAR